MPASPSLSESPDDAPDNELVEQVRDGDTDCFARLMRRYNQRLFRVARAIVRDDTEAEDVVQHAYVSAYSHLHTFAGNASFSTWLTRIVINQALMSLRARLRQHGLVADRAALDWRSGTSAPLSPEDEVARGELVHMLERAIDALPDVYRAIVVLRELEGMNTEQAAQCLSISDEAARVRLHRARSLLREELWQRLGSARSELFTFGGERCARIIERVLVRLPAGVAREVG